MYLHPHAFGFIFASCVLHKIPLQDCVLVDTGLNIILAGWKETKNNFVPRLQAVRKVTRQSFGKPKFALIGAQWRALFCKVIHRGRRIHLLYIISLGDFFFKRERKKPPGDSNSDILLTSFSVTVTPTKTFLKLLSPTSVCFLPEQYPGQ